MSRVFVVVVQPISGDLYNRALINQHLHADLVASVERSQSVAINTIVSDHIMSNLLRRGRNTPQGAQSQRVIPVDKGVDPCCGGRGMPAIFSTVGGPSSPSKLMMMGGMEG